MNIFLAVSLIYVAFYAGCWLTTLHLTSRIDS